MIFRKVLVRLIGVLCPCLSACTPTGPAPDVAVNNACYIETVPPQVADVSKPLSLRGWVYLPGEIDPAPAVAVRFEDDRGLVFQRPIYLGDVRSDVAEVLHLGSTQARGFDQRIDVSALVPGRYQARLVQFVRQKAYVCKTSFSLLVR